MELSETFRMILSILDDIANSPNGMSTGEIVSKYGISRRVVPKYISIMETAGIPIYTSDKRYYVHEDYRTAFTLTPEESELLALSLQRSLILHRSNRRAIRALTHKLGSRMPEDVSNLLSERLRGENEPTLSERWFSTLAEAKRHRFEVVVAYHPLNRPEPARWQIRPYQFVVNPFSDGLYVLCEGTKDGAAYIPLSLKFDRILDVQKTTVRFGVVEKAGFATSKGIPWGVWSSNKDPVRVVLRFDARHYDRLLESIWHPSQNISIDHSGEVKFSVMVSEPQEMIPWIRGWGSGVVVLEPESLRQRVIQSLIRQMHAYGLDSAAASSQHETPLGLLWAKYDPLSEAYHPLIYHLLDTAAVAWVMWNRGLSGSQRRWLMNLLELDDEAAQRLISFLVGLHDIGKATPSFQQKAHVVYEWLVASGLSEERKFDVAHGTFSTALLLELLRQNGVSGESARVIAAVIGGHHGVWINDVDRQKAANARGGTQWQSLQAELFQILRTIFLIERIAIPENTASLHPFAVFLSGFVSVCDWIGSHEEYFSYQPYGVDPHTYLEHAILRAQTALDEIGWQSWTPSLPGGSFAETFAFEPNDFQHSAITILKKFNTLPRLILVEHMTGGGKTELALHIADTLLTLHELNGAYIAMPTQATSNQMYARVSRYLQARYPDQIVNLQLAHAQSDLLPLYQQFQQRSRAEGNESGITAESWFQNRKRTLLAPYAVGTVDQAMMGVLQVQHHFVRQFALSHKVIIFDEIHSYDTYMNEIISRLIGWLTQLQSPLILLSATLPENVRRSLLEQANASLYGDLPAVPYPRLTIVEQDGTVQVHPLPRPSTRTLYLRHIDSSRDQFIRELTALYEQGGCIAVICNTVNEAIELAHLLREYPSVVPEDVLLFHARFPAAWRSRIEQRVLASFGKDGQRPARAILVATQIIEQSLDLDFDVMVTSTAPIDLLIQRAGRLHRHHRSRLAHLAQPTLIIRSPKFDGDVPDFGVDQGVYARWILLKTWLVLREREVLRLPDELDAVMDFVYGDEQPEGLSDSFSRALAQAYKDMELNENRSSFRGAQYLIAAPGDDELVSSFNARLPDNDDDHNITTRDIRPGVDIICMSDEPNSKLPIPLNRKPTTEEVKKYLQFRMVIHDTELVRALKALPLNPHWERIGGLRYARAVIFRDGKYEIPESGHRLKLTRSYGLEYIKEETV